MQIYTGLCIGLLPLMLEFGTFRLDIRVVISVLVAELVFLTSTKQRPLPTHNAGSYLAKIWFLN